MQLKIPVKSNSLRAKSIFSVGAENGGCCIEAMTHQARTLNGKISMLLCPHNPEFSAAQNSVL